MTMTPDDKLRDLIQDFGVVMLVTCTAAGFAISRFSAEGTAVSPMAI